MKYILNILRVLVGLLFIFSGFIKLNDPTGFSYKLDEYFSVFASDLETAQDSVVFSLVTVDGKEDFSIPINQNSTDIKIQASNSPWQLISSEGVDSIKVSKAVITIGNKQVYTTTLNNQSDDSVLLETKISWSLNNDLLGENTLSYVADKNTAESILVDTQEYVKPNSWIVGFLLNLKDYALELAIFLCVVEVVLGLALLIGWAPKFTVISLVTMIVLFTFLTWYSATYNKVTDCGCFGDAIKLTPWESFYKDVILSVSIFFIVLGIRYIKPIFSKPFAIRLLTVTTLFATVFAIYCWHYLPVNNFLKFKKGNNIKELAVVPEDAPSDVYENVFIYSKNGIEEEFTIGDLSNRNLSEEGYTFVDRKDILISEGYEPEIHDFKIMDESRNNDYVDDFFGNDSTHKIMIVMNDVSKANVASIDKLKEIIEFCKTSGIDLYPLTASNSEVVDAFRHEHQLDFPFYYGDKTNLKSIIRSNPGLVLMEGNVVKKNWPSTRLPSVKRFSKVVSK